MQRRIEAAEVVKRRGLRAGPTNGARAIQCGENARMAAGRGKSSPSWRSMGSAVPGSRRSMGEPCETNRVGWRGMVDTTYGALIAVIPRAKRPLRMAWGGTGKPPPH